MNLLPFRLGQMDGRELWVMDLALGS